MQDVTPSLSFFVWGGDQPRHRQHSIGFGQDKTDSRTPNLPLVGGEEGTQGFLGLLPHCYAAQTKAQQSRSIAAVKENNILYYEIFVFLFDNC